MCRATPEPRNSCRSMLPCSPASRSLGINSADSVKDQALLRVTAQLRADPHVKLEPVGRPRSEDFGNELGLASNVDPLARAEPAIPDVSELAHRWRLC